jgi:peptidoglycan/xylan/chitin deacetylase (PgdA/CDA1 family)
MNVKINLKLDSRLKRRIFILIIFIIFIIALILISNLEQKENKKSQVTPKAVSSDGYENIIAITFDDGPRKSTTTKLLDGLDERGVKATFFLVGEKVSANQDIVKRMHDEGHLIGNHTYSHIDLGTVSYNKAYDEIIKTNEIINEVTGEMPKYIRPPYGNYSEKLLKQINMTPVLWSVDPDDWNTTNVRKVVNMVVKNAKGGDIILLHDVYDSTVTAALEIIDQLQAKGFIFVTVDQLLLD